MNTTASTLRHALAAFALLGLAALGAHAASEAPAPVLPASGAGAEPSATADRPEPVQPELVARPVPCRTWYCGREAEPEAQAEA